MGKGCKKEEVPRQERRIQQEQRHTQGKHGIRNGTTERMGTEKWRGQGLQKGEDTGTEDTHRKARKTHKKPHMKTPHIYKVETGKTGKGRSTHRLTEDKRSNYPEEDRERKAENGRKRRTTDKRPPGTENENDQASPETKRYLTATVYISPATAAPRKPPTLQHHGCPADKGGFSWAAYGNNDTGRTGQARHGKSEYPYLQDKSP